MEKDLIKYSKKNNEEILKEFKTNKNGYSNKRARDLLDSYGMNITNKEEKNVKLKLFIKAFANYFNALLFSIIIISIFTDVIYSDVNDFTNIIVLSAIILISSLTQFIEELKSHTSLKELKEIVKNTTRVVRDNKEYEVPLETIVPGDIIKLSAGDIIPADLKILESTDLFISDSAFTGESLPVEKRKTSKETNNIFELENILLLGSDVISGSATAIVIKTGFDTHLSKIEDSLEKTNNETSFDIGIKSISLLLIKITLFMVPLVFSINYFKVGDLKTAFIFSLTVAVGTTPELLPMIINSNLAKGLINMSKKKVIVKNLSSIQNLGAIDILCTDKTGTITEDKIVLDEYLDIYGNEDLEVLKYAYLNSYYQTGLKNLLDLAIINRANKHDLNNELNIYKKVDEIPFDFERRRMSVVLKENNKRILVTKGAAEELLSISKYVMHNNKRIKITDKIKKDIYKVSSDLNKKGLRVITVALKDKDIKDEFTFSEKDEKDMTIIGFVSFLDPPKESAKDAINLLKQHNVITKVITGDNELVAKSVSNKVGLNTTYSLTGEEIINMSDDELRKRVDETTLFSKVAPLEKARILRALKDNGHVVGYLGDGINDAPALKEADVGISVDTGVEIAKETADIVLLEKSLLVLEEGIIEGREVFANIMKYLNMSISSNVGNMISFIAASIFIPFLPILPTQILIQNLLYDFSQLGISFDNVDEEDLLKPKKWNVDNILKFTIWFGPLSSIFDFIIFYVLWTVIGANSIGTQALFQSGWFIMGVVSQTIIIYIIRTRKVPFYKSKPSNLLLFLSILISIIGVILPYLSIGKLIGLVPLPYIYIFIFIIVMTLYMLLTEIVKIYYLRKYKELY